MTASNGKKTATGSASSVDKKEKTTSVAKKQKKKKASSSVPAAPTAGNLSLVPHSTTDGANQFSTGPLERFFTSFNGFEYKPNEPASAQMSRLKKLMEKAHKKDDEETRKRKTRKLKNDYNTALVRQFNLSYGKDENDLAALHKLLQRCGITNLPKTVAECKRIVKSKYINLVDLEDARSDPTRRVQHFATEQELSDYTHAEEKYFPRDHVEAGNLLKYLLRHIHEPGKHSYRVRDRTVG